MEVPMPQPTNCTSEQDVATVRMNIPEEMSMLAMTSEKTVLAGREFHFSGKILYSWPYKWENGLQGYQQLINKAAEEALKIVNMRVAGEREGDLLPLIKDIALMPTLVSPQSWRETALEDEEVFRKLVLYIVYFYHLYAIDDMLEGLAGGPGHAAAAKDTGRLLFKIFVFKFETVESIRQDSHFKSLVANLPKMQNNMCSLLDIALEMKERFKVTASQSLYLARGVRWLHELQTWFGSTDLSHIYNQELRNALRSYTVGFNFMTEFCMLLDGVVVSQKIRDDFYWNRQYEAHRTLCHLSNDIISAKKEIEEKLATGKPIDNAVFICMDVEKVTFEEALARVIEEHNKKLLEFRQDMKCMAADPDLLFDFDDEEKVAYFRSLESLGTTTSHMAQSHIIMGRYKLDDVTRTFEPYTASNSS